MIKGKYNVGQKPAKMGQQEWDIEKARRIEKRRLRNLRTEFIANRVKEKAKAKAKNKLIEKAATGKCDVVYVISYNKDGPCKIGITDNLKRRLAALQTGCPYKLKTLQLFPTFSKDLARKVELGTHAFLSSFRLEGEWFDLDSEKCQKAVETIFNQYD